MLITQSLSDRIACAVGFLAWEMYLCPLFLKSSDTQRKTLDPGLRLDDVLSADGLKFVIPAKGCSGGFRPHAVCPRNSHGVLAMARPARGDPASLLCQSTFA